MNVGNIICLKLMSGEELVGTMVADKTNETFVGIKEVASIIMMPGAGNGQQYGLGLAPFLGYSESDTFQIARTAIVVTHEPNIDMINNYNRLFGAGIQVVGTLNG